MAKFQAQIWQFEKSARISMTSSFILVPLNFLVLEVILGSFATLVSNLSDLLVFTGNLGFWSCSERDENK